MRNLPLESDNDMYSPSAEFYVFYGWHCLYCDDCCLTFTEHEMPLCCLSPDIRPLGRIEITKIDDELNISDGWKFFYKTYGGRLCGDKTENLVKKLHDKVFCDDDTKSVH
jgi:hypothetical protein